MLNNKSAKSAIILPSKSTVKSASKSTVKSSSKSIVKSDSNSPIKTDIKSISTKSFQKNRKNNKSQLSDNFNNNSISFGSLYKIAAYVKPENKINNKNKNKKTQKYNIKNNVVKTLLRNKQLTYYPRNMRYELEGIDYKPSIRILQEQITNLFVQHFLIQKNNINNDFIINDFMNLNYHVINYYLENYTHDKLINNERILFYLKGGNAIYIYKKLINKILTTQEDIQQSDTDYNLFILTNTLERYKILYMYVSKAIIKGYNILSHIYDALYEKTSIVLLSDFTTEFTDNLKKTIKENIIGEKDARLSKIISNELDKIITIYNKNTYDKFYNKLIDMIYKHNNTYYDYNDLYKISEFNITNESQIVIKKKAPSLITSENEVIFKKTNSIKSDTLATTTNSNNKSKKEDDKYHLEFKKIKFETILLQSDKYKNSRIHYVTINNTPSTLYNSGHIMSFDLYRLRFSMEIVNIDITDTIDSKLFKNTKYNDFFIRDTHRDNKLHEYYMSDRLDNKRIKYPVSPEFIDISVISFEDSTYQHFLKLLNENPQLIDDQFYVLYNQVNNNKLLIMNEHYLLTDLQYILFKNNNIFPYYDSKYEKRLSRLFYFILFYLNFKIINGNIINITDENKDIIKLIDKAINNMDFSILLDKKQDDILTYTIQQLNISSINNIDTYLTNKRKVKVHNNYN